jgi:hypothetical protein
VLNFFFNIGVKFLSSKVAVEKSEGLDFSQPTRPTILMIVVLLIVLVGAYFMFPSVAPIFFAAPFLNGLILAVFVLGVLACFFQIYTIASSVSWIEGFALDRPGHEISDPPRLLAALASLLKDKRSRRALNATSARSILDSVATRLDEARDITRYIINLLIFLGLLGTFYGLATTVPAVVETIRTLAPKEGQTAIEVFEGLMEGLENQLGGMGTAFASSLLGLAGSLVVGLIELFSGHGQNRFYMELEEWISSFTRLSTASGDGEQSQNNEEFFSAIFEQTNNQIVNLRGIIEKGEVVRQKSDIQLDHLIDIIEKMATTGSSTAIGNSAQNALNTKSIEKLVSSQTELLSLMTIKVDENSTTDQEARNRLRNIDIQLARIHEELSAGRQDTLAEVRSDISALSSAILQLVDNNRKKE